MADDNNARYRTSDPFGRLPAQAAPANDPLAELARLIGQSDPFSEFGRDQRQPAAHDPGAHYSEPAPQAYAPEPDPHYADPAAQRYAGDYAPRFADSPQQQSLNDWPGSPPPQQAQQHDDWPSPMPAPPPPPAFLANLAADPYGRQQPHAPQPGMGPYDSQPYADPRGHVATGSYQQPDPSGFDHHQPPPFTAAQAQQAYSQPIYPHEPEAGSMPPPHDDEFYDDAPRGGRRKGMLTVAAVLALAVVGTAGAFGYRSMFSGPNSSSPPPVIRASNEPSKVAPPAQPTADPSAAKISYDRFNDAGKDEQVVKREEKPVDVPKTGTSTAPRVVFPGAPAPNTRSSTTAANAPSALGEPRRVRTVPIRPDAGDQAASASESAMPLPPPRQANAQPPARTADVESDPAPASRASSRNTRVATRSAPVQAAPAPAANAPLSLSPDANNSPSLPPPSAAPSAPQREASRAPAPSPRSTASSGGGGYLVQVSSQKSESDAQSSFRGIQSKYASVLSGQPHTVRRADLGSKGVYYRAMVGPYGSREEAIKVCSSLKQAGGDCVVQH